MPRDVDERKTRKALRKLQKAVERAELEGVELTEWEQEFIDGVNERLNKYGSAFADLSKGDADEALSMAQSEILKQIDKKSRGKLTGGFTQRKPLKPKKGMSYRPSVRRIDDDMDEEEISAPQEPEPKPSRPKLAVSKISPDITKASELPPARTKAETPAARPKPQFRVIDGGKS